MILFLPRGSEHVLHEEAAQSAATECSAAAGILEEGTAAAKKTRETRSNRKLVGGRGDIGRELRSRGHMYY